MKQIVSAVLAAVLLAGLTPTAFASAEPAEAAESPRVTESVLADPEAEIEPEEAISAVDAEMPEDARQEENFDAEVSLTVEPGLVYCLPSGEEIVVDPEDPLYAVKMGDGTTLLSAWNEIETYRNFTPRQTAGETVRPGIDVSSWQGTIRWDKVADAGVEFAFIRGAYRGTNTGALGRDGRFEEYYTKARAAGIRVGVYVYSQAITEEEGREEARFLLELLDGRELDLPIVIDYEYYGSGGRLYNAKLTNRQRTDICLAFCQVVEEAGYEAMVYGNASMLGSDLYAGELDRVWLAHYTKKTGYKGAYDFWQCSASGSVSGISGDVDLDFWFDAENPFSDVAATDWFFETVMEAYDRGIVSGMGDGSFAPDDMALRGQTVTMLHRIMGKPASGNSAGFTDLTESYYRDAVNWAANAGIVKGCSDTEFDPNGRITRQDLVTILYRMEGCPEANGNLGSFSDASDVRAYAQEAMAWAVEKGILYGYEDNTLCPGAEASRAEVCAILIRYTERR